MNFVLQTNLASDTARIPIVDVTVHINYHVVIRSLFRSTSSEDLVCTQLFFMALVLGIESESSRRSLTREHESA